MDKDRNKFKGIFVPIVTPFNSKEQLDEKMTHKLCDSFLEHPVQGYYVGGSTGECFVQTIEERSNYLKMISKINNEKKIIIAHIGSTALNESLYLGKIAKEFGYDAIASVPPFYYQYTKKEIFSYYEELVKNINLPFFIYNIPSTTNVEFSFTDLEYLLKIDNIVGVKHTTTDFFIVERIKESNPDSIIFNGPDQMLLAGLSMGCDGGIGTTYNLMPSDFCKIYYSFHDGDWPTSKKYQSKVNNVIQVLLGMNIYGAIKYLLKKQGIDCGNVRKPFAELNTDQIEQLNKLHQQIFLN